jgi:methylase of polypeptide subunit release factors
MSRSSAAATGAAILASAVAALRKARVPEPALSAEYLLAAAVGGADGTRDRRATLSTAERRLLTVAERSSFDMMVAKRIARMPVQMIVGEWDFHGITLQIQQGMNTRLDGRRCLPPGATCTARSPLS